MKNYLTKIAGIITLSILILSPVISSAAIAREGFVFRENLRTGSLDAGSNPDRVVVVGANVNSSGTCSAATYGGVSMTLVNTSGLYNGSRLYSWILVNPATGSNNIAVTCTNGGSTSGISLSGAAQTGQPEAQAVNTGSGTTGSVSVNTVAANSWVVGFADQSTGGNTSSGGDWVKLTGFAAATPGDTNGPKVTPGTVTFSPAFTSSGGWGVNAISIAPSVAPAVVPSSGDVVLFGDW